MRIYDCVRERFVAALLGALLVALPAAAGAQSVVDPSTVEFTPSADHNATSTSGVPIVTGYDLGFYLAGASQPFQTQSLGKPTPAADGQIRFSLASLSSLPAPGVVYESRVAAVGPGGSATSPVSNTFMFSVPCTYGANPLAQSVAANGGGGTITVTAGTGCGWTAQSNSNWLTIAAGATGAGGGAVTFSAAANTGTSPRTGTLTVATATVTITQAGAACSFGLTPTSLNTPVGGGTHSVGVSAGSGCTWTASSSASWLRITGGGSGSGGGTVQLATDANASTIARTATLSVGGQTTLVSQPGAACSFGLTPTSLNTPVGGGTHSVGVSAGSGCTWTASSSASWLRITGGGSGSGGGTVQLATDANASTIARTATLVRGRADHPREPAGRSVHLRAVAHLREHT